jgi:cobalt/nickel transport system permease protein
MLSYASEHAESYAAGVDPRAKLLFVAAFSVIVALLQTPYALLAAFAASIIAWFFSGVALRTTLKRMLPLDAVFLVLAVCLPLTTPGNAAVSLGPFAFSQEGFQLAAVIALKGNAIVLMVIALMHGMEPATLGYALSRLGVPKKLSLLFLFMIRYIDVLQREYHRLRDSLKVRAFRPGVNRHTYRAVGYLVGMLLIRSLDRSERIAAAMKCRGFAGRFYLLDHFAFTKKDVPFCAAATAVLILLAWMELCLNC